MNKENNEDFFKIICKKYIDTMSKEMLLETENNKILHIFIEDEYIELKENGSINLLYHKVSHPLLLPYIILDMNHIHIH